MKNTFEPLIVGIGGTANPSSSTELALRLALTSAERCGARVRLFGGDVLLRLPHYLATGFQESKEARDLVAAVREADGLVISSPGYHGSISGLVKNAIDYIEETSRDSRVYLDGLPVGLITTAYGWQATGSTLATLRSIVHALRGWPTPMGAAIKTSSGMFSNDACSDSAVASQLEMVGRQVAEFAKLRLSSALKPQSSSFALTAGQV